NAPAGTRTHINQATTLIQRVGGPVDGTGDLRPCTFDGACDLRILVSADSNNLQRCLTVEVGRRTIGLFRAKASQIFRLSRGQRWAPTHSLMALVTQDRT